MANIPLVDLKAQYESIAAEVRCAIDDVLASCAFINGPAVREFEREFAAFCEVRYAVGVASGTAALMLALKACGVGPGDEVVTVAHTFTATGEAIALVGATPVFVDISPDTFTLDPRCLDAAVTAKTKAIVPVHLYGQPADMDPIVDVARRHGLTVIEDAAQSHGASYKGRQVGSLADAACFSFYPGKNLGAYGDAGAVTTNRQDVAERVAALRDHGRVVGADGRRAKYEHAPVGYGERLDTLHAEVLRVKLRRLPAWNDARRRAAARYDELLRDVDVATPAEAAGRRHVYHLYVIRTRRRDDVAAHLRACGIDTGIHYPIPLHRQPAYAGFGYLDVGLPETERAARDVLSLPMYPELTDEQILAVTAGVRGALAQ